MFRPGINSLFLDMDAHLLQQQQLSKPACNCPFSDDSDVLMKDPFLDYINEVLMADDATYLPLVDLASYQAIFSSFQDILTAQRLPHISHADPARHADPPILHHEEYIPDEHQLHACKVARPADAFYSLAPSVSLSADGRPQSSLYHERAEVNDSGFQGHVMGRHNPLKSTQTPEQHEATIGMHHSSSHLHSCGSNKASVISSSSNNIVAQKCHNVIQLNESDGEPLNAMVSCLGKHAAVDGPNGHGPMGGLHQGNHNFMLPSGLAEVDLSFEGMNLNDLYADLYVGEPCSSGNSTRAARDSNSIGDKKEFMNGKGRKFVKKSTSSVQGFVDVREVLIGCAKSVAVGDVTRAREILQELRQVHGASANGTGLQRIAHYFSEALAARLRGMGENHYRALFNDMPSAWTLLKASKLGFEKSPIVKLIHYFANQSILKAAQGASRLHVVDFEIVYGTQWPCLINALADREGGPPLLVITGIEFPQMGASPAERLEGTGRRLAAYAKTFNVPFEFHAIVTDKWEDLNAASLCLHEDEVLAVNCVKCLCHLPDESADLTFTSFHRQTFLTCMRNLNPHLLLTVVTNAAWNSPFFVSRFREALYYFCTVFDAVEVLWDDNPERLILESSCFYRDILNIVACEGSERVERPETCKQWHGRITKAGFQQLPIPPTILSRSKSHVKQHHHNNFFVDNDADGWMFLGWKGRSFVGMSAWKPSLV